MLGGLEHCAVLVGWWLGHEEWSILRMHAIVVEWWLGSMKWYALMLMLLMMRREGERRRRWHVVELRRARMMLAMGTLWLYWWGHDLIERRSWKGYLRTRRLIAALLEQGQ